MTGCNGHLGLMSDNHEVRVKVKVSDVIGAATHLLLPTLPHHLEVSMALIMAVFHRNRALTSLQCQTAAGG